MLPKIAKIVSLLRTLLRTLLLPVAAAALLGACSTPCDAPGRLCAPITSNTSVAAPPQRSAPAVAAPADVETYAVQMPSGGAALPAPPPARPERPGPASLAIPTAPAGPMRIALLLPLRSDALGQAAGAVRAGFMAALERERDGVSVDLVETGDVAQDVLASYAAALEQHDLVVGPLARSAVSTLAGSGLVLKPTIALNTPEGHGSGAEMMLPPQMLAIGLSIEDEARQAAGWAARDYPGASALVVGTEVAWQRRVAIAFASHWQRAGAPVTMVELGGAGGLLNEGELAQLRARVAEQRPGLLFAALGAGQARQLRAALGDALPLYGTSALNPGNSADFPLPELDGARLLDLPWQLQRDHAAVMAYPRPPQPQPGQRQDGAADLERLYALGIDAYRIARQLALHPEQPFQLDGVTGRLLVGAGMRFERIEQPAVYRGGMVQAVQP